MEKAKAVLGTADQRDAMLRGDAEHDAARFLELHAETRDAFLENSHLVVAGDEFAVDRVDPGEIGELFRVAPRCRAML